MKTTHRIAAAGTAGLLTLGALGALPAAAQDDGTGPGAPAASAGSDHQAWKDRHDQRKEDLAAEYGVSVDQLEAARRTAHQAVVDQYGEVDPADPPSDEERDARVAAFDAALAEALGVTVDDVDAARTAVFTDRLEQGVASGRITQEEADEALAAWNDGTFREYLRERFTQRLTERLDEGVASGRLPQEVADQLEAAAADGTLRETLAELRQERPDLFPARPGPGGGFGGGFGGRPGR